MRITRIFNDLALRHSRRRAAVALAELSDHQLRDIGITRHDLFAPRSHR